MVKELEETESVTVHYVFGRILYLDLHLHSHKVQPADHSECHAYEGINKRSVS